MVNRNHVMVSRKLFLSFYFIIHAYERVEIESSKKVFPREYSGVVCWEKENEQGNFV